MNDGSFQNGATTTKYRENSDLRDMADGGIIIAEALIPH
jgi:hypothetical protein